MSLIHTIITDDFATMAADTQIRTGSIRINGNLLIGMTGKVEDNLLLFSDFCEYMDGYGYVAKGRCSYLTYKELADSVSPKFQEMFEKNGQSGNQEPFEIKSIICGRVDNRYEITFFNTITGIHTIKDFNAYPYRLVTTGKQQHHSYLDGKLRNLYIWREKISKEDYLQCIKDTFKNGSMVDEDLDNEYRLNLI